MKKIIILFYLLLAVALPMQAQWTVSGKVTDAKDGSPLIGATIEELGTNTGTITDFDGSYSLSVSSGKAVIQIKYVGYTAQDIPVADRTTIDVTMSEDGVLLEQVVVVGYGVQRKSDVTGSIASVKGKEIEKIATSNIEQALQGKVAGLHVTPASGNPGAGAVIRIRGTGTLNNANPLYVIDGMITYDASLVNPQDVESIEILKDASAAAIYGSRGANGVIIITTKNGRNRKKGQISLSTYYGTQQVTRQIEMLNGQEFAAAYNQLRGQAYYPDPSIFGEGTNYQNEVFREAPIYNVQLSANGGNEQSSYNFSANYFNQDGILKNTGFQRGTFRLNSDTKLNSWLSFGSNLSFLISKSHNGPNVVGSAYRMPSVLAPYTESGDFTDPTFFGLALANPLADQFYKSNSYSNGERLFGNAYLQAEVTKGLTIKSNFGYDRSRDKSRYFEPEFEVSASQRNASDRLSVGQSAGNNWIWEQTLTYDVDLGENHSLTLLGGYTAEERSSEWIGGSREHFPGTADELLYLSAGNDTTQMNYGGAVDEALISQLFRVNYGLKNKYFVTASLRRDQSSRFTEENRTGYFPSASFGWNLGREGFIEKLNVFTDLKLRMSYGILGNQASASTYPSAGVVSSGLYGVFGSTESLSQGATLLSLSNPNLHWETSSQADIGIDASFFEGKLTLEADWYRRLTYDIISSVPIPSYVGSQSNPVVNTAEVLNRGFDLSLKYNQSGSFSYSIGANVSPVHNEVTKLAQGKNEIFAAFLQGEPASHTVVGLPIGAFYGYQVEGVFQSAEEIAGSAVIGGEKPGDLRFKDIDGNNVINDKDRVYLGSPIPTLTYGFSFNCDYKGFDFAADVLGVSGNKVYNAKETFRFGVYNWEKHVADAWTPDNPSTTEPRVTNGGHNYRVSDRFLQDGSFLRLRTLALGYTLPQGICERLKLGSLRVYISANNIYTRQKYTGYSPEFANSGNPFEVGFDNGNYPIARSTQFGLDLKF